MLVNSRFSGRARLATHTRPHAIPAGLKAPKRLVAVWADKKPVVPDVSLSGASKVGISEDADVLTVESLRDVLIPRDSPFIVDNNLGGGFVGDMDRVRLQTVEYESLESAGASCPTEVITEDGEEQCMVLPEWCVRCGPRKIIYHDPSQVTAAIVVCGRLCPGINDVVQNVATTLMDYGVMEDRILGIRYGLSGFYERDAKPVTLSRMAVDGIHLKGGSVLGTSAAENADINEIMRRIDLWGLDMLFVVGGKGSHVAAHKIHEECKKRSLKCSVVGIPKSIENEILLVDKCFGLDTAVEEAQRALFAAKVEASSARNGVGIVKLNGRTSGFLAMNASMASGVVDICLIPELGFNLERLCEHIRKLLARKGHCVICMSNGAGFNSFPEEDLKPTVDAAGKEVMADVGVLLRNYIKKYFKGDVDMKYIDPTNMIEAVPTNTTDRIYCKTLAQTAVHGAFAGYTDFAPGLLNTHYSYFPIPTLIQAERRVNLQGRAWNRLIRSLNQPPFE